MKRFKIPNCLFLFTGFLMPAAGALAQDVHFAQVQDMNIWNNPALKTNKIPVVRANMRSVKYQGITAYTSKAASIELPLIGVDKDPRDVISFMNLAVGINADNASGGAVNVSTAMMAFSYALPLNDDNTWLAAGFQATYTFSRVEYNAYSSFPSRVDENGPIGAALLADPYQSGNTYGYLTAGAGAAIFHTGEKRQWYFGGSARHLNQPFTDPDQKEAYRLPMNRGIQAGYTAAITNEDALGGYASFSWQGTTYEHIVGTMYNHNLGDSATSALFLGIGYRIGDALLPGIGFRTGSSRFAFSYEIALSGTSKSYNRNSFEFSYALNL